MAEERIYVFDAYGTLFDVHSAASRHAAAIGPGWERLSEIWRNKQLEYTWTHVGMGRYRSFRQLTSESLDFAISATGGVPQGVRDQLLNAYAELSAYPEAKGVLARLKEGGASLAILSNGDPDMLDDAIAAAGLAGLFDAVMSVAAAGTFKPSMAVYALATRQFKVAPSAITFVSSNRWDIAGAKAFGFRTVWINRRGAPDEYPELAPDVTAPNLQKLADMT